MKQKSISRRDFLKGASAGALGVAIASLTGGLAFAEENKASYTPGTYSATVQGYSSFVKVEMTFSEDAITDCVINAAGETPTIGGAAAAEYAKAVVDTQNVDAVTSATASITMPAVKKAVANCIAQATSGAAPLDEAAVAQTGDWSKDGWLGTEPDVEISSVQETDLLIVGAGNGGLIAAATAADAGMDFIVAEKNATVGDTRMWVGAVDTDEEKEAGVEIQKDRLLNELARYASYKVDMSVIKLWIEKSGEMIDYLKSLGMIPALHIAPESHVGGNNMDYYVPSIWHTLNLPEDNEFAGFMGADRNGFLKKYVEEKGHEIQLSMDLVKLVHAGNKVTGAVFRNAAGEYVQINANNVILATGGYAGNPAMIEALQPTVCDCVTANSYYGPNTGTGIKTGLWAGAKMDVEPAPMIFDRGLVAPGVKAGYVTDEIGNKVFPGTVSQFIFGTQPHLKVNKEGERFANESCPYDFFNHAASLQTDGIYAAIMDAKVSDNVITYDQYGCAQIAVDMARAGMVEAAFQEQIDAGLMFKADTMEELADKLQIPADTLVRTVERYNELCTKGSDDDFGKEAYRMIALDQAPYYGAFFGGSLLTTCDGLRINRKMQVYNKEHKIIEGLYCVGDCSGSFFSGNYPEYFVGVAVGRTLTEGRYAVKAILGEEF